MAVNGATFYFYLTFLRGNLSGVYSSLYGVIVFWFLMVLIPPLITMRAFSEEKRSGTYELLVTTGVGEVRLVLAKFAAALTYFLFLWAALLPIHLMVERTGNPDWGVLIAIHLGLLLLGSLYTGIGILASTLTQNQLATATMATVLNLMLFFANYFRNLYGPGDLRLRYFDYVSPMYHFTSDFTEGVLDYRYLVLYGSATAGVLFLAVKCLEWRRWW